MPVPQGDQSQTRSGARGGLGSVRTKLRLGLTSTQALIPEESQGFATSIRKIAGELILGTTTMALLIKLSASRRAAYRWGCPMTACWKVTLRVSPEAGIPQLDCPA
jgi:hypothetical protein